MPRTPDHRPCTEPGCDRTYPWDPRRLTTLCRKHASVQAAQDPARRAKLAAAMREKHADPEWKAMRAPIMEAMGIRRRDDPEYQARNREHMRRVGMAHGGTVAGSPGRIRAGKKLTERALSHIPLEYRDEYRLLQRKTHMKPKEISKAILDMVAADTRSFQKHGVMPQKQRSQK